MAFNVRELDSSPPGTIRKTIRNETMQLYKDPFRLLSKRSQVNILRNCLSSGSRFFVSEMYPTVSLNHIGQ